MTASDVSFDSIVPANRSAVAYARPATIAAALDQVIRPGWVFAAGATTFAVAWESGTPAPAGLVDVSGLPELAGIERTGDGGLDLGAGVTLAMVLAAAVPLPPALTAATAGIGAPGVRELATCGGNLGWRQGDLTSALLVLAARLELQGPAGRRSVALEDWLRTPADPAELLCRIRCRADGDGWYEKVSARAAFGTTIVAVAAHRDGGALRLAAHGAGLAARRLHRTEQWAENRGTDGNADGEAPLAAAVAADLAGADSYVHRVVTNHVRARLRV